MESLKMIASVLVCLSGFLQLAAGVATSHQSMVSGDGWRYSYGIVHGPEGHGHAVGESYPHGYGGFGTYAPSYSYEGYAPAHHDIPHISALEHHELPHLPALEHHEVPILSSLEHHEEPHLLPVPAVHAPVPALHSLPGYHSLSLSALPLIEPYHKSEEVKILPIKSIHPLPHALPEHKLTPEYVLPSYLAGHHYGGSYLEDYSDLLSHFYDDHHYDHSDLHSYEEVLSDHGSLYGDYSSEHLKPYYKANYNDYYGATSYQHHH